MADAYIIHGPNFFPSVLIRKMNQFNALDGDESTARPREWNSQPPAYNFKYRTFPLKTSPVVSDIMGILHHHAMIMVMLRFTLQGLHFNPNLNLF